MRLGKLKANREITKNKISQRHCEGHRVELWVSMGCGNLILKNQQANY
jgi:hypothetical protein